MHDTTPAISPPTGASACHRIKTALAIFLACLSPALGHATPPAQNFEQVDYRVGFANHSFPDIPAFTTQLKTLQPPFQMLFEFIREDENAVYTRSEYKPSELRNVQVLKETPDTAIVEADASRNHDFCAVVFLLEKESDGWQISDMIRRCDWGSGAYFSNAGILPLSPRNLTHLHIAVGRGGRIDGSDDDEFFVVKDGRFKRAPPLATGCYFRGRAGYGEYSQSAEPLVKDGKLQLAIKRSYRKFNEEKADWDTEEKENFVISFHWNAGNESFVTSEAAR